MSDEAVLTNISEMIDLAIGTPEVTPPELFDKIVGVVDFCMLQTVLHCLAQQLRILGKNVELRGSVASLPVGRPGENTQSIAISEFIVDTEAPGKYELATGTPAPGQETVLVVERHRKLDATASNAPMGAPVASAKGSSVPGSGGPGSIAPSSGGPGGTAPSSGGSGGTAPSGGGPGVGGPAGSVPGGGGPAGSVPGGGRPGGTAPSSGGPGSVGPAGSVPSGGPGPGQPPVTQGGGGHPGTPQTATESQPATFGPKTASSESQSPPRAQGTAGPTAERLSLVTLSKFNLLENTVEDLKNRVYGSMPKNEDLLEEVRSQGNLNAITDMWTNLNVSSRLEAAEEGIGKLGSLIQDLIGETVALQKATGSQPSAATAQMTQAAKAVTVSIKSPREQASDGGGQTKQQTAKAPAPSAPGGKGTAPGSKATAPAGVTKPSTAAAPAQGAPQAAQAPGTPAAQAPMYSMPSIDLSDMATKQDLMQLVDYLQMLRNDLNVLTESFYNSMKEVNENFEPPSALPRPSTVARPPIGPTGGAPVEAREDQPLPPLPPMPAGVPAVDANVLERLIEFEKQLKKCFDAMKKSEGLVNDQLTSFQDQLEYMTKQIASVSLDLGSGKLSPDLIKDLQGLMQLFQTVQDMQAQLKQVHDTALQLAVEKEDRQHHIDALLEQIELLKTIKLDREDMVEALADKADLRMLARKVSHDQFEMACDDLAKGLEHALGKLNVQESLWQQALDDIQREIETKLDKMELSPVKEFFNNKLKQLQANLKQMAALRREAEAAGTKRRLLRDVNCISCDAKAIMAMDPAPPLPPKPLPATLSMKPYLSYELDAIRKTQASGLPQRNMHDWEHIDKQMQPKQPYKVRSETDKHLCNRYCGGSHTVTTPAQRVARLGHFIKQWGPEVLPLSSGLAAGDDGRIYKISNVEGANVGPGGAVESATVCTPKSPVKKAEPPKSPKPIVISAECRCLEQSDRHSKN